MSDALRRTTPVELSADARFAGRVRRLAMTSVVALGIIWFLSVATLDTPAAVTVALAGGWLLMPTVLVASLAEPRWRYALVVPASLVGLGLLAISVAWRPEHVIAAAGWLLMTVGVLLGGMLGLWFWYRLLPVPPQLDHPFSRARLILIRAHVALIVGGGVLAAVGLVAG